MYVAEFATDTISRTPRIKSEAGKDPLDLDLLIKPFGPLRFILFIIDISNSFSSLVIIKLISIAADGFLYGRCSLKESLHTRRIDWREF